MYAKDGGLPPNYAKATVRISVLDENDNAPFFGRLYHTIDVPENLEAAPLFTLRATDQDAGESEEISYRITGGICFFYCFIFTGIGPVDHEFCSMQLFKITILLMMFVFCAKETKKSSL